jgi:glucose/arabinose dehydrogenase
VGIRLRFETVARGFTMITAVAGIPDGSGRLLVLEKDGRALVVEGGQVRPAPFLDLRAEVATDLERGLLGVAFHPRFGENRFAYFGYTATDGALVYERYRVAADGLGVEPASAQVILTFPHAQNYHNGGHLAFGPEGYLYIATGDNGDGRNAQDLAAWHGKVLRLDVDGGLPYRVPPDNPFVGDAAARPEVWALGLRNPWRFSFDRFSFDRATGELYTADVGAAAREEVNFQAAGAAGGANYGWPRMEGGFCLPGNDCGDYVGPILEYDHGQGCSITGGYAYRGSRFPAWRGAYFFSDWCGRVVWAASRDASGGWRQAAAGTAGFGPTTFGEDEAGELYLAGGNQLVRVLADGTAPGPTASPTATRAPASPTPTRTSATPTRLTATPTATPTGTREPLWAPRYFLPWAGRERP